MTSERLQQLFAFYKESPGDSFIRFAIAKEYENMGETDRALEFFLKILHEDPDYVGTYYHLGKVYEKTSQPQAAFETYKKGMAIAKKAGDQHALSELAGAKLNLGDDEDFE